MVVVVTLFPERRQAGELVCHESGNELMSRVQPSRKTLTVRSSPFYDHQNVSGAPSNLCLQEHTLPCIKLLYSKSCFLNKHSFEGLHMSAHTSPNNIFKFFLKLLKAQPSLEGQIVIFYYLFNLNQQLIMLKSPTSLQNYVQS